LITSKVVAVPKSITILFEILFFIIAIELASLSAPISFKLYLIFKNGVISLDLIKNALMNFFFKVLINY